MQAILLLVVTAALAVVTLYFNVSLATEPAEPGATRPNIVLIMADDQDTDSLPAMQYLMSYPNGSWVNFTNAFTNVSLCCPARSTVLTGQYSQTHGVTSNFLGGELDDRSTLPVWLDQAGYHTILVGKYLNHYPWGKGHHYVPPGWDDFLVARQSSGAQIYRNGNVDDYSDWAVEALEQARPPFFLYLAYAAPHAPALPPVRYRTVQPYIPPRRPNYNEADVRDKPRSTRSRVPLNAAVQRAWDRERLASQRELMAVDDGVERIIATLQARGQLDNTIVIYIGDNGFSWGSHRIMNKWCVYDECNRIPLLIRYPGAGPSRVEPRLVSNVDLAATLAEAAGVAPGIPQDGRSFLGLLRSASGPWQEQVLLEKHSGALQIYYGIRVPGWKYVEYRSGERELYDLTADPYELQNLAGNPAYQSMMTDLSARLADLLDGS